MPWTIDAASWTRQLSSPILDGSYPSSLRPVASSAISMNLSLTTAGRLGFFIDYSELSAAGTHTFYVARTHGSTGAVGVTYTTGGDAHSSTTGSINWANTDMGVKSFTVEVTSAQLTTHQTTNGLGEHRIWAVLSSPTGGGVLHFGTAHTRAYGVIDNNVLASDANAVFYDSAASAGTGTQASPYNNVYTAIANIGTKRYLYGKGTTTVTNANTAVVGGGNTSNVLPVPPTRTGEADRVYVRNWSGSTWTVTGTGTVSAGFFTTSGESYQTYKGIDFLNLDNSTAANGFGIFYLYGGSIGINTEICTADDINGKAGSNNAAYMPWGVDGGKVWRCTSNNIQENGSNVGGNTAMFETYDGVNISIQRCEATNSSYMVHHKRVLAPFTVSTSVKFCKDTTQNGILYGASGSSGVPHSYTIAQCNLFLPTTGSARAVRHNPGTGNNGTNNATKHWWCNNVFYQRGSGAESSIQFKQAYDAIIFNNIYLESRRLWNEETDTSAKGPVMEYANYELHFGTTLAGFVYEYQGIPYGTAAELQAVRSDFAVNDAIANPLFTNAVNGDFTLQGGSPALTGGVDGTQQGLYLGNFYTVGAS